jgi:hypothetical protein
VCNHLAAAVSSAASRPCYYNGVGIIIFVQHALLPHRLHVKHHNTVLQPSGSHRLPISMMAGHGWLPSR